MVKEILLNDQGLKMTCVIDFNNISFDFDESIAFLKDLVSIEHEGNLTFVYLGMKKILRIEGNNVQRVLPITNTEIRILKAIYNYGKSSEKFDLIEQYKKLRTYIIDHYSLNRKKWKEQSNRNEFHTHFIEILNSKELLNFLRKFDVLFPMNDYGELDFTTINCYTYDEVVKNGWLNNLENALRLDVSEKSSYADLVNINNNRRQLLQIASSNYREILRKSSEQWNNLENIISHKIEVFEQKIQKIEEEKQDKSREEKRLLNNKKRPLIDELNKFRFFCNSYAASIVYNKLLDESLDKLSKEGIKYSEISYSNETRIDYMASRHMDDNRFKFLYSIDRSKKLNKYEDYSMNLEKLLAEGKVIGTDIMGLENNIGNAEYDEYKDKLEWILPVLHIHPDSVLRLHAAEYKDSTENIYKSLLAIKETSKRINDSCVNLFGEEWGMLPPPRVRIGHVVNITNNPKLIALMKALDVVVEVSISSGYALGKNESLKKMPLNEYRKNGISYVLTTDGGGVYGTSMEQEENIHNNIVDDEGQELVNVSEEFKEAIGVPIIEPEPKKKEKLEEKEEPKKEIKAGSEQLYKKFIDMKRKEGATNRIFASYYDALAEENSIFEGLSEEQKVEAEINKLRRYIDQYEVNFDINYFNSRVNMILNYSKSSKFNDVAKIYTFLLEKELFADMDTSFKSIEYLYLNRLAKTDSNLEKELFKLFGIIESEYTNSLYDKKGKKR